MPKGGARKGAGRPKGSVKRGEKASGRIVIACLESEVAIIKEKAKQSGKNVSRYLVELALNDK